MSVITESKIDYNILPDSKKIKKMSKLHPTMSSKKEKSEEGTPLNSKKYKTFQSTAKKAILFDIKKKMMQLNSLPYSENELDSEELLKLVSKVELGAYNKLLKEVLEKHISTFSASQKSLTQWRKKIKGWLYTSEKPEYRGSPVVTSEKLPAFREEVIKILKSLPFRCFADLRQRILAVLERHHKANASVKELPPFNPNVCSKHWWFNFMQKNTDIKEMWEKIPLKRETSKHNLDLQPSQPSTESQSQDMEEEKLANLSMTDPIFSEQMIPPRPLLNNNGAGFAQGRDLLTKQGLDGMTDMTSFLQKAAWQRLYQQAFLMKLSMLSNLQIPPFQNVANNESVPVKAEPRVDPKDKPKVEVVGAKKEEGETKVKMEEEANKAAKKPEE